MKAVNTGKDAVSMDVKPGRETELFAAVDAYQKAANENYERIKSLAQAIRAGFCAYIGSASPPCVLLVPPMGPFEPKDHGDEAFSVPPKGLKPLGPVAFGLAIRLTPGGDWMRQTLVCLKEGAHFTVRVEGGPSHRFALPLYTQDPAEFFEAFYRHILFFFDDAVRRYEHGEAGAREIGFDFFPSAGNTDTLG